MREEQYYYVHRLHDAALLTFLDRRHLALERVENLFLVLTLGELGGVLAILVLQLGVRTRRNESLDVCNVTSAHSVHERGPAVFILRVKVALLVDDKLQDVAVTVRRGGHRRGTAIRARQIEHTRTALERLEHIHVTTARGKHGCRLTGVALHARGKDQSGLVTIRYYLPIHIMPRKPSANAPNASRRSNQS